MKRSRFSDEQIVGNWFVDLKLARRVIEDRPSLSTQHGPDRMCGNPELTYDWTKHGRQVSTKCQKRRESLGLVSHLG